MHSLAGSALYNAVILGTSRTLWACSRARAVGRRGTRGTPGGQFPIEGGQEKPILALEISKITVHRTGLNY